MDDTVRVQVLQRVDYLCSVALDFELVQTLASFEQLVHGLVLAELQQNVHVFAVLEEVLKVAHVLMLNTAVDLDLTHELLLGATLCEGRLLDDFGSVHEHRLGIDELEAFGEAALAEELALEVPADAYLAVLLLKLLLHNRLRGARLLPCVLA